MPCSFAAPVVVTLEVAKFCTVLEELLPLVEVLAPPLLDEPVVSVVEAAVVAFGEAIDAVPVVAVDELLPVLDPAVPAPLAPEFADEVDVLATADAADAGSPVEAAALDTGPLSVAIISGA